MTSLEVAPLLLGMVLSVREPDGTVCEGTIVETEAYGGSDDPASHAHRGETSRNRSMFETAGTLYVYLIYGIHWCANVVCGPPGEGSAVLIRALAPTAGHEQMFGRRAAARSTTDLTSGPGKLCAALAITGEDDGLDLFSATSRITLREGARPEVVATGPRIGITKAVDRPWRFAVAGSPHLSRPI